MVNIVLDCMGEENSSQDLVKGAVLALKDKKDLKLILVGEESKIKKELKKYSFDTYRIEIIHANDVIFGTDEPVKSIRTKKDSSLVVALSELVSKNYDAVISTGNSGAFLAGCLFIVGRISGVNRPALAPILNGSEGKFILLDAGANVDCKVDDYIQFAKLGSVYYKTLFDKEYPVVKLLNIGTEENKGNFIIKKVYVELSNYDGINFNGNLEVRNIMDERVDVVICDGFIGNITLKTIEGTSKYVISRLRGDISKSIFYKFGGKLILKIFSKVKDKYDYRKFGGAIFLGVRKICIKSHGNSNEFAIKNSIDMAYKLHSKNFIQDLQKNLFVK